MAHSRAWQAVESLHRGRARIVSYLEVDLARDVEGSADLRYVPFFARDPLALMAHQAQWWSQFGTQAPSYRSVLVVRRGEGQQHFAERYPGHPYVTHRGSTVISADVAEVAVVTEAARDGRLVIEGKRPCVAPDPCDTPQTRLLAAVLGCLWREGRILYWPSDKTDFRTNTPPPATIDLIGPLSSGAGCLSDEARAAGALAAFNSGFFILPEEEYAGDPYTFALDPVGLVIADGRVANAPLFERSALVFSGRVYARDRDETIHSLGATRPAIRRVGLSHYAVRLPGGIVVRGHAFAPERLPNYLGAAASEALVADVNPPTPPADHPAFYNRLVGLRQGATTSDITPPSDDRLEIAVVGEFVCAFKEGGETFIPRNGYVLSLPRASRAGNLDASLVAGALRSGRDVSTTQAVDLGPDMIRPHSGTQVWLRLLEGGRPVDIGKGSEEAVAEEYVTADVATGEAGIPPIHLFDRYLRAPDRAFMGFGIRPDRRCFVALIEGCEPRTFFEDSDSAGGSIDDLVTCLQGLGCTDAVALDSGGSAGLIFGGTAIARPADRNDVSLMPTERIGPGAWMISDAVIPACPPSGVAGMRDKWAMPHRWRDGPTRSTQS